MISKEEMKEMTACELEAYMRGYRDGQVDLREILYTNVIPAPTRAVDPALNWTVSEWKDYLNKTFGVASSDSGNAVERIDL